MKCNTRLQAAHKRRHQLLDAAVGGALCSMSDVEQNQKTNSAPKGQFEDSNVLQRGVQAALATGQRPAKRHEMLAEYMPT